jgi:rhodanese-related sulfurtransferase
MKVNHILWLILALSLGACNNQSNNQASDNQSANKSETKTVSVQVGAESQMLLDDLAANGDYVNSREFPSLIDASKVHEMIGANQLIIDLRSIQSFKNGHISGAIQKDFAQLPAYFESGIKPFEYERIILLSDDGQTAAYATMLLRLMGYGNVFAMRWGMSSWNKDFAQTGWMAACSSSFQHLLDTVTYQAPQATALPELKTGASSGEAVGTVRFQQLFEAGLDKVNIDAASVFNNPENYFIINYDRKDKYEAGHIPGAIRFKPNATLGIINEMASIPHDKTVVVYCGTGHNSAFVTAYLRLFGYDARTLAFGNNSFMYDKMLADRSLLSWLPFTSEDVYDFKVVK